jgi:hypothetical protein
MPALRRPQVPAHDGPGPIFLDLALWMAFDLTLGKAHPERFASIAA